MTTSEKFAHIIAVWLLLNMAFVAWRLWRADSGVGKTRDPSTYRKTSFTNATRSSIRHDD
jgi:hypothetical protein